MKPAEKRETMRYNIDNPFTWLLSWIVGGKELL